MSKPFNGSYDLLAPDFRVYIEGVQVPFMSFTVSSGAELPQASIVVPASPFLMDIARNYSPKVHIFYSDRFSSRADPYKLLFSGIIAQVQYQKSTEGNIYSISFACYHKYTVMRQLILDYVSAANPSQVGSGATVSQTQFNSLFQSALALKGISSPPGPTEVTLQTTNNHTFDYSVCPSYLAANYANGQYVGLPGVALNFWQQVKGNVYAYVSSNPTYQQTFFALYKPLVEGNYYNFGQSKASVGGLQFFQRMQGHPFIENQLLKEQYNCGSKAISGVHVPPGAYSFIGGAAQIDMAVRNLSNFMQSLGEQSSFLDLVQRVYDSVEYDLNYLTSPVVDANGMAYDVICKPRMPFYYAPSCNVYYPAMYDSLTVSYDEYGTPTRLTAIDQASFESDSNLTMLQFRSPPEWRTSIANAQGTGTVNAGATMQSSFGAYSVFEQGRGAIASVITMPQWLTYLQATKSANPGVTQTYGSAAQTLFAQSWADRYGALDKMNPYSTSSGLVAYQQLLMASVDSFFVQDIAKQKMGNLEGPFNPYIIPGYSMDILEASPTSPSFHAQCVNVTHSVQAGGSARTSVSFVSAMTYSELANYYYPMISPWLQLALNLAPNPSIVNNPSAASAANQFYSNLGSDVSAAIPEVIFDFTQGRVAPVTRGTTAGLSRGSTAGTFMNPIQTNEGSLFLNFREIESKSDIAAATGVIFIDLNAGNYTSTVAEYTDPKINDTQTSSLFSLGESQFLSYVPMEEIQAKTKP